MKKKRPFFSKFLENQMKEKESTVLKGGVTLKAPSDLEDLVTLKHPTDLEETTDKYPSDSEDE